MGAITTIARRTFLLGSAAVAGGLAVGYWAYKSPIPNPLTPDLAEGEAALTPYVRIDQSGVTIITPRAEMGQGVHTTLAALVAEELDLPWEQVKVEHGPASTAYFNAAVFDEGVPLPATDTGSVAEGLRGFMAVPAKFMGMQITGGSSSMPDAYVKMRKAGAAVRVLLITAAAAQLKVGADQLKTEGGAVVAPDGTRLAYTALALAAARLAPPADPPLKPREKWTLLGKSLPRTDMTAKCTGTAPFSIDIRLPGMLYAAVRMNPNRGAAMSSFDGAKAEAMPGVKKVMALDNGVAVIATNTWYALKAVQAVDCKWEGAAYGKSTDELFGVVAKSFDKAFLDNTPRKDGDVDKALAGAGVFEAEYRAPYLAHTPMEPLNAAAWLRDGKLEIWAGNQAPTEAVKAAIKITGLKADAIRVHTTFMGGGFGRRAEMDFIKQVVTLAKAMEGTPIKLTWSREEDIQQDVYRPMAMARVRGAVKDGLPTAIDLKVAASSVAESQFGRLGVTMPGPDPTISQASWDQPYGVPNYRVTAYRSPMQLPVSSWRSVGSSQNGFFHESAMDELAHAAGADPMEMRLRLITHEPSRKVLEAVAEMSGWGSPLPQGAGRGVAFVLSFGVPVAEVVEVATTERGLKIVKVFAAADVGVALDPRNVEAQIQSAIAYGLTAAIMGEITVKDGVVEQSNFYNYDALRMHQAPAIDVRILENGEKVRGIGEPGTPPAAPALANAIFAATGQRIRELPLRKSFRFV